MVKAAAMRLKPKSFVMTSGDVVPIEHCDAAAIFVTYPKPPVHPAAWHGIFVHRYIQYARSKGRDYALRYIKKYKGAYKICEALDLSLLPEGDDEVEVVVDIVHGTASLGAYRDADAEQDLYCRTDTVWATYDTPNFTDYKTGDRGVDIPNDAQMQLNAVGHWLLNSRPKVVIAHVTNITIGLPHTKSYAFDHAELVGLEARFKRVHRRMNLLREEWQEDRTAIKYNPGKHCVTCKARFACQFADKKAIEERYAPVKKPKKLDEIVVEFV